MKLAIVGITGVVGEMLMQILNERKVPVTSLDGFASRTRTETIKFRDLDVTIRAATADALRDGHYDAVLFASSDDASAALAQAAVDGGAVVIDNSATFRMDPAVPLIVPEVNPDALQAHHRIFPVANCTAIVLCVGISAIAKTAGLRAVRVATYQSVSGAGRAGLDELAAGEVALSSGSAEPAPKAFAAPIARNVIPKIGSFDENGDSGEELKIAEESRKILSLPQLHVAASTVRVPVRYAHSEVVFLETERDTTVAELKKSLATAPGVVFHQDGIVTPREVEGGDLVHVARLRAEGDSKRFFQLWIVGDQVRKGAATNAVQILELLRERNMLGRSAEAV
jgi:aspartate-semialdehyde dehydrogenase